MDIITKDEQNLTNVKGSAWPEQLIMID